MLQQSRAKCPRLLQLKHRNERGREVELNVDGDDDDECCGVGFLERFDDELTAEN